MIVCETTIIGYTVINGTWQLQLGLFVASLYQLYAYPNIIVDPSDEFRVKSTMRWLVVLHFILIIVGATAHNTRVGYVGMKTFLNFFGMMLSVYVLFAAADANFVTPQIKHCPNVDTSAFVLWIHIELIFNIGIVLSNVLFLFLRSVFKHKLSLDHLVDAKKRVPTIDTLLALQPLSDAWNNEAVPFILCNFIWFLDNQGRVYMYKAL